MLINSRGCFGIIENIFIPYSTTHQLAGVEGIGVVYEKEIKSFSS